MFPQPCDNPVNPTHVWLMSSDEDNLVLTYEQQPTITNPSDKDDLRIR